MNEFPGLFEWRFSLSKKKKEFTEKQSLPGLLNRFSITRKYFNLSGILYNISYIAPYHTAPYHTLHHFIHCTIPYMHHTIHCTIPYIAPYHTTHCTIPHAAPYHTLHHTTCCTIPHTAPHHTLHHTTHCTIP